MLTEQDKKAIDACITRPNSVWEGIKSIITAEKYTWYLESLAKVQIKPDIAKRKAKWDAMDADARIKYMETPDYDEDLKKVLQQVATVLGGNDSNKFQIGSYIKNWIDPKKQNMFRHVAFKTATVLRFTIDETRQLLFTVLADDEQTDFNPRLPNEMIYAYAIINGILMTAKPQKINEQEVQQPSVENMLYEAKIQFLGQLFGNADVVHFPRLIEIADNYFNILDSVNMTKAALFMAAIKTSSVDVLLKNIFDEIKEDSSQTDEETSQTERRPKLLPDASVMQRCYEYVSYDHEDELYVEGVAKPVFEKAQISKHSCLRVLKYVSSILETAPNLVNQNSKGSNRRVAVYSDMKGFIEKCIESVEEQSEESVFSVLDFMEILGESNLGQYSQSEFSAMIDNIIIDKLDADWQNPRDKSENGRVSSYHGDRPQLNGDQAKYFHFFFDALEVATRDLRAITERKCKELWSAYVIMNQVLAFPYFSHEGVGMKVWEHEEDVTANCREYTYTIEKLQYNIEDAENMPDPSEYITSLLSDDHCFSYFNKTIISRGKEKFISELDDEGKLTGCCPLIPTPLFIRREDGTLTQNEQDEYLRTFYDYMRFNKQYFSKALAYSRSDILKLAFWSFMGRSRKKKYNPELGPDEFITYFDEDVASDTCCAAINESNSLDRFLLLCLEHEEPVLFLKEAIAYQKTLPKKKSKNFWKMLH